MTNQLLYVTVPEWAKNVLLAQAQHDGMTLAALAREILVDWAGERERQTTTNAYLSEEETWISDSE